MKNRRKYHSMPTTVRTAVLVIALVTVGIVALVMFEKMEAAESLSIMIATAVFIYIVVNTSMAIRPALSLTMDQSDCIQLRNSGSTVRELKIDVETNDTDDRKALYLSALDSNHMVKIPIESWERIYSSKGFIKVLIEYEDIANDKCTQKLEINFAAMQEENRELGYQQTITN